MIGLPIALGCSIAITVLVLRGVGRFCPPYRFSWAFAAGTAAGHIAWTGMNELAAAEPSAGLWSVIEATLMTYLAPRESGHWVVIVLLIACLAEWFSGQRRLRTKTLPGSAEGLTARRAGRACLIWGLVFAGAMLRLLWGSVYLTREWSVAKTGVIVAVNAIALATIVSLGRSAVAPRVQTVRLLLMTCGLGVSSVVIGMSGSAVYAQLTLMAVVSLFICTLFAWRQPLTVDPQPVAIGMILLVTGCHLWLAHFFSELTLVDALLLGASMAASSFYGWGGASLSAWRARIIPAATAGVCSLAALTHAGITLAHALAHRTGY